MVIAIRDPSLLFSTYCRRTVSQTSPFGRSLFVLALLCPWNPAWRKSLLCLSLSRFHGLQPVLSFRFFWLGATTTVVLVLWQVSFLGIRVGEASNPRPTMSNLVPASDGVSTPLLQFQDQDLEVSVPGPISRPSGTLPVSALSLSPSLVANPYRCLCASSPARFFCLPFSFLFFLPLAAPPARPALSLFAAVLPLRHPLSLGLVFVSSPPHPRARLFCPVPFCPDHFRPSHGWATFGPMHPPTSMLTSRGSSWATSRWTGFAGKGSVPARCASGF